MKKIGFISAMLFLFGMSSQLMAQNDHSVAKDNQKNQAQLTLSNGDVKYYNTEDVQSIDIKDKQVRVAQAAGNDVFDNLVTDISFFKAQASAAEVTKADLIGLWEVRGHEESGEEYFALRFTENEVTFYEYGEQQQTVPYTLENGVLTYKYPATEWSEAYTESKNVSLLYDKSVLLMKYIPEDFFLANVAVSAIAVKKNEKIAWYPITFRPRQGGVNSTNMKRIFKIGVKALGDFRRINRNLR
jgi:hypothetical protein